MIRPLVSHPERCPQNEKLQAFLGWWLVGGPFPIVITWGNRTDAEQWTLYQQGRTKPGKIVTHAKSAAESAHGHTGAFDASPVREFFPSGGVKLVYTGDEPEPELRTQALARLATFARLAKEHGLQSGADFPGLHDSDHVQDPDWRSRPVVA